MVLMRATDHSVAETGAAKGAQPGSVSEGGG